MAILAANSALRRLYCLVPKNIASGRTNGYSPRSVRPHTVNRYVAQ